jgi:DNA-binding XRE family transcriptional regulator
MLVHTRKHPTKHSKDTLCVQHAGITYEFPKKLADKYRVPNQSIHPDIVFAEINKKYTKPGALLRGIRVRENLTQSEMAKCIQVTQSDISQMENGVRKIGRKIAQRVQKLFDVDYRSFLE